MTSPVYDIIIIGGGFSGGSVIYQLAQQTKNKLNIVCFEPRQTLGLGIAYGDCSERHILNVRAKGMSINEGLPNDYTQWLESLGYADAAESFTERKLFGQYVKDRVYEQINSNKINLEHKRSRITSLSCEQDGLFSLRSEFGERYLSKIVILANGVVLANSTKTSSKMRALHSPWVSSAFEGVGNFKSLAIVGTGLTALDVILECEARGFGGTYLMISRHGKFPLPHLPKSISATKEQLAWANQLLERKVGLLMAFHEFRAQVKTGADWYHLIDSLRTVTQAIWKGWSQTERFSFMRHLRWAWDIHRHQAPANTIDRVNALIQSGRMNVVKGRLLDSKNLGAVSEVIIKRRGGSEFSQKVDKVFDGMGLGTDILKSDDPMIKQILEEGLIAPDDLGIGFMADPEGRAISQTSQIVTGLYILGPLRRGQLWESTAARELRSQARIIAQNILNYS
jgi:uncharacterized NAD(P)/FAD-binding protein YdhS